MSAPMETLSFERRGDQTNGAPAEPAPLCRPDEPIAYGSLMRAMAPSSLPPSPSTTPL
jgi:hypothetical protein